MNKLIGIVFLALLFLLMISSFARAFKLPDSGQSTCYNSAGNEIPCPPSGQDGAYAINAMSFTDNGNGTVTDNNTGLMWQKGETAPQQYNWFQASGAYNATHNPAPVDVCGSLVLGSFSDWRLPTKKELATIVDYSIPSPGPTINHSFFPYAAAQEYWTADRGAQYSDYAWLVQFSDGQIFAVKTSFTFGLAPTHYVRCVRGAVEPPALANNLNGTVTDNRTGLMWQRDEAGAMKWDAALARCKGLNLGEHQDWRLPNIKELESLTDDGTYNPAINRSFFPTTIADKYWSSTTNSYSHSLAWAVDFFGGSADDRWAKPNFDYNVRCVRNDLKPPAVTTAAVSTITQTTVTGGGYVTFDGWDSNTTRGVCWSTSANPAISSDHTSNGIGAGPFTSLITGLSPYTSYHIRAYANNVAGTAYGEDISFTTNLCAGDVQRGGANHSTIQDAVSNGSGSEIKAVTRVFWENLSFTNSSDLALNCGYACGFGSISGVTAVHGTMTISGSGAVALSNLAVY